MALTRVNTGRRLLLEYAVNQTAPANYFIGLFTNDLTITDSTVWADIVQPTDAGYSAVSMNPANFTFTTSNPSTAAYPQVDFSFDGAQTVYGYFIAVGTTLVGAERFTDGPYEPGALGGQISVTYTEQLQ